MKAHFLTAEQSCTQLQTSKDGLSKEEAQQRLQKYGLNQLQAGDEVSPWAILFEQFKNILVVILLIATAVSAFLGHTLEAVTITLIVLFAVLLGFIQEYRAEHAIRSLRKMTAPVARVIRDGKEQGLDATELVPGDILQITAGDKIPADARLLSSVMLQTQEAVLTGESLSVEKNHSAQWPKNTAVADRTNMLHSGTIITRGHAQAVVTATAMHTEFGKIASLLQKVERERTPLQKHLDRLGRTLAQLAFVIVILITLLGLWRGQPFVEMLIFAIALAVAVVPEALPAVVTISLAIGVQQLVKRNALMRRLSAVETLGSTSVICSDKTGTLTRDQMTVRQIYTVDRTYHIGGIGYLPSGEFSVNEETIDPDNFIKRLLIASTLATDTRLYKDDEGQWSITGDPTEGALIVAAAKAGIDREELFEKAPRLDEIPFRSETRCMTVLHRLDGQTLAFTKGAPEFLINHCSSIATVDGDLPLYQNTRDSLLNQASEMASQALRVLAICEKPSTSLEDAQQDMCLLGLIGMMDPPRAGAKEAIALCNQAGVRVIMITGDHPQTALAIARELGIKADQAITGVDVDAMDTAVFEQIAANSQLFARVSPKHKLRIVDTLQKTGAVVAMTGDGVNDAPALKRADIGVAMGITGTEVAREASEMTLLDDRFSSIVEAVEQGRVIFDNIRKFLMFLLSSNLGEIGLILIASLVGAPIPLTAVQILFVNLVTDGLPALALAVDPPEKDVMKRKPRANKQQIFTLPMIYLGILAGVWASIINFGLFYWMLNQGKELVQAMSMVFVSLILIQFFNAYNFRSFRHSIVHRPFINKWLNYSIILQLFIVLLLFYVPLLQEAFGTYPMPLEDWLLVILVSSSIVPVMEIGKFFIRRL